MRLLVVLQLCLSLTYTWCLKDTQDCTGYECLKAYVDRPDPAYTWEDTGHRVVVEDYQGRGGWTGYFLNFTSQQWLTPEDTSRSVWWHLLVVVVPEHVEVQDTALLWLAEGHNDEDTLQDITNKDLFVAANIATSTGMVAAVAYHIPNEPILYAEDPLQVERSEDANLAFTWWRYLHDPTSDAEYILNLPMTKAGVRAMDTVHAFFTSKTDPSSVQPTQFIVSGVSKRGWTTWLLGAVDPRVVAIVPVMMDELNFVRNIKHHYKSYGGWSFAFADYWALNLTLSFDNPKMQKMFDIIDPFEHRDKLLMPKLVCDSAGDEFFLLDDTRYWWQEMPMAYELNRFLILPNTEHEYVTGILELLPGVSTWISQVLDTRLGKDIPRYNWTVDDITGDITVMTDTQPASVTLWHATTCDHHRRDFRLINIDTPCECGVAYGDHCINLQVLWSSQQLEETFPGKKQSIKN